MDEKNNEEYEKEKFDNDRKRLEKWRRGRKNFP
jgi:hypothetical protein